MTDCHGAILTQNFRTCFIKYRIIRVFSSPCDELEAKYCCRCVNGSVKPKTTSMTPCLMHVLMLVLSYWYEIRKRPTHFLLVELSNHCNIFGVDWKHWKGFGSVILLRPKIGLAPQKHDVISMPRQQYTNTKHIPIESYHPVVSIMPRHMDPKKIFGQNLCCSEVKIDKISGGDLPYFSLKCDNLP